MDTITVPLILGTAQEPECLDVYGQRMLVGPADTGIFRLVDVGGGPEDSKSTPIARAEDDGLALATIEFDGALEVADRNAGGDPCNRHGREIR